MVITVDGVPAAEIGPISAAVRAASLDELMATGAVVAPQAQTPPPPPKPVRAPSGRSSTDALAELRDR
jgi:antitoxin (DNA-binding transcriptional repressor) of toxin-antitoxin stability system